MLFLISLAILLLRARAGILPVPVAFLAALDGPLLVFAGLYFVMFDANNWPLLLAALLSATVSVFARETFDTARSRRR